jgi:hypothetical protein
MSLRSMSFAFVFVAMGRIEALALPGCPNRAEMPKMRAMSRSQKWVPRET